MICPLRAVFFARCSEMKVFYLTVNLMVMSSSVKFVWFES